jgi:hypothetical protein
MGKTSRRFIEVLFEETTRRLASTKSEKTSVSGIARIGAESTIIISLISLNFCRELVSPIFYFSFKDFLHQVFFSLRRIIFTIGSCKQNRE